MIELFTAICFIDQFQPPKKYRNIKNIISFEDFAKKQGIKYINYYFKKNKQFAYRKYVE
jgi:hypothetical protein